MEGSVAAAGGQGAGGAAAGDGGDAGEGAGGPDIGALAGDLASMKTSQGEMFTMLQQLAQSPALQPQGQDDGDGDDGDGTEDLFDLSMFADGDDDAALAKNLAAVVNKAAEEKARAMISPVADDVKAMRRDGEIQALLGEFPELGDDAVAQEVSNTAKAYAQAVGHPEHADEPWFIRSVYMMGRAAHLANEESGDQPGVAHLEGGGGASPGGGGQVNPVDTIMGAGPKRNGGLPFG